MYQDEKAKLENYCGKLVEKIEQLKESIEVIINKCMTTIYVESLEVEKFCRFCR